MRKYSDFSGDGGSDVLGQVLGQRDRLAARLASVRTLIPVMSGKGGVGKSTVTVGLAAALARRGLTVGVIDADLNGPCIPLLLGLGSARAELRTDGLEPPRGPLGIKVMSSALFLGGEADPLRYAGPADDAFAWRPAAEVTTLRELLTNTLWGELDALLVDLPPGAERLPSLSGILPGLAGAVVVTLGSPIALGVVRRSVTAAREHGLDVLGLVENMAGLACGDCGVTARLFGEEGAARRAADSMGIPFLGAIPFDRQVARATEEGRATVGPGTEGPASTAHDALAQELLKRLEGRPRAAAQEAP